MVWKVPVQTSNGECIADSVLSRHPTKNIFRRDQEDYSNTAWQYNGIMAVWHIDIHSIHKYTIQICCIGIIHTGWYWRDLILGIRYVICTEQYVFVLVHYSGLLFIILFCFVLSRFFCMYKNYFFKIKISTDLRILYIGHSSTWRRKLGQKNPLDIYCQHPSSHSYK